VKWSDAVKKPTASKLTAAECYCGVELSTYIAAGVTGAVQSAELDSSWNGPKIKISG